MEGLHGLRRTIALQRRNTRRWHAAGRKELKTLVVIMRIRHDDVHLASIGKCMRAVINIHGAPDVIAVLVVNERLPNALASVDEPRGNLRVAQPCLIMSTCKKVCRAEVGARSTHSGSTELT